MKAGREREGVTRIISGDGQQEERTEAHLDPFQLEQRREKWEEVAMLGVEQVDRAMPARQSSRSQSPVCRQWARKEWTARIWKTYRNSLISFPPCPPPSSNSALTSANGQTSLSLSTLHSSSLRFSSSPFPFAISSFNPFFAADEGSGQRGACCCRDFARLRCTTTGGISDVEAERGRGVSARVLSSAKSRRDGEEGSGLVEYSEEKDEEGAPRKRSMAVVGEEEEDEEEEGRV